MPIDTGTAARLVGVATVAMGDAPTSEPSPAPAPAASSTTPPSPAPAPAPATTPPAPAPTKLTGIAQGIVDTLVKKDKEAFGGLQKRIQGIMENNSHYELIHTLIKSSSIPDELSYIMEVILQKMDITGKRLSLLNDGDSLTISGSSHSITKDSDTYKITKTTGKKKDSVSPSAKILGVFEYILSQSGLGHKPVTPEKHTKRRRRR